MHQADPQGAEAFKDYCSAQIANVTSCPTPMHSVAKMGAQDLVMPVTSLSAVVCAACPPEEEAEVTDVCRQQKVMKAFGRYTSGRGIQNWVQQWEAQVVQAVAGLVAERDATRARIVCIEGGPDCGEQMAAQQHIVSMIRKELSDASFPIRVEWMPIADFWAEFGRGSAPAMSSTSESPEAKRGARERTPSVLRLRKESLTAIWVCEECQAYFDTKQNLVDHQQSESHWGPLCEDNGRHLIRESDFEALEAGDVVIADPAEDAEPAGSNPALAVPPIKLADANDDGCVVFNLSSPRSVGDEEEKKVQPQKPQQVDAKAAPMTCKVADPPKANAGPFAPKPRAEPSAPSAPPAPAAQGRPPEAVPRLRKQSSRTSFPKAKQAPQVAFSKELRTAGSTPGTPRNTEAAPSNKAAMSAGEEAAARPQAPQTPASAATRNSRPAVSFESPAQSCTSPVQRGRNANGVSQARCRSAGGLQQMDGTRSQNLHASTSTPLLFNPELDPRSWPALGAAITRGPRQRSLSVPRQKRR
mmetsp:Transcript_96708/g.167854  ORF Transcript_96708/g.167854 Transcript_96708/m.167854 type:complete len:528 (-) Transcript_96708:34-1617(-)